MGIRSLQGFEREASNPRRQPINYVNLVLGSRKGSVHYALECNESKLQVDKKPVKNVSGETAWSVLFTSDKVDP